MAPLLAHLSVNLDLDLVGELDVSPDPHLTSTGHRRGPGRSGEKRGGGARQPPRQIPRDANRQRPSEEKEPEFSKVTGGHDTRRAVAVSFEVAAKVQVEVEDQDEAQA